MQYILNMRGFTVHCRVFFICIKAHHDHAHDKWPTHHTLTITGLNTGMNWNWHLCTMHRSTSQGLFNGLGRIGAILANIMFGYLLDVSRPIPILIVALVLSTGAGAAIFLPPIYRPENQPPLERAISRFKSWLCSKFCHHWCALRDGPMNITNWDLMHAPRWSQSFVKFTLQ